MSHKTYPVVKSIQAGVSLASTAIRALLFCFVCAFLCPTFLLAQVAPPRIPDAQVMVNQLGYYPNSPKLAVVTGPFNSLRFALVDEKTKEVVYRGNLGVTRQSQNSSISTRDAVFSNFKKPGRYLLTVAGLAPSAPFEIKPFVHHDLEASLLKGYYFQRASMPLDTAFAGKWRRALGHPDTVVYIHASAASRNRPAGIKIQTPGGWYDASDYNKYVVPSGITCGTLLSAYEDFPEYYDSLKTFIPESKNNIPDILNETVYNLRWMLAMQDPEDGGVYHKCTNAGFDRNIMPELATKTRYVVQKGTAASLDFAAVTAQAARVLKIFEPKLADSCLSASEKAWAWAIANPHVEYNQAALNRKYELTINTTDYADHEFADEWFWSAAELFATTQKAQYYEAVVKGLNNQVVTPSWSHVQMLGYYALLHKSLKLPSAAKKTVLHLKLRLISFADSLLLNATQNAFGTVIGHNKGDFAWGSNAQAASQANILIKAYLLTGVKNYLGGAISNLDYLMGRNALGYCFVTGLGTRSPLHPNHRISIADEVEEPVPGLLVGGPNPSMQDEINYTYSEAETSYMDLGNAFACNGVGISWNAPLVYLAGAMEALEFKAGFARQ